MLQLQMLKYSCLRSLIQESRVGVSAAHVSLAEARWRPGVRDSTTAIETVREDVERTLYRSVRVQVDRTRQRPVPASCSVGRAAKATPAHPRLRATGRRALAGNAGK